MKIKLIKEKDSDLKNLENLHLGTLLYVKRKNQDERILLIKSTAVHWIGISDGGCYTREQIVDYFESLKKVEIKDITLKEIGNI